MKMDKVGYKSKVVFKLQELKDKKIEKKYEETQVNVDDDDGFEFKK